MEAVKVFEFCRNFRGRSTKEVLCGRFGTVSSCAACSVCPKCSGRMALDTAPRSTDEMLLSDGSPMAVCRLCGFRKNPGKSTAQAVVSQHQPMTAPEPPAEKEKEMAGKPVRQCVGCKQEKPIIGRGLCGTCYHRSRREGTLETYETTGEFPQAKKSATAPEEEQTPSAAGAVEETVEVNITPIGEEQEEQTVVEKPERDMEDHVEAEEETLDCQREPGRVYRMEFAQSPEINVFLRSDERDEKIRQWLKAKAYANRREIGCEVVAILEKVMDEEGWMEEQLQKA